MIGAAPMVTYSSPLPRCTEHMFNSTEPTMTARDFIERWQDFRLSDVVATLLQLNQERCAWNAVAESFAHG
jgi:hypothetical protein